MRAFKNLSDFGIWWTFLLDLAALRAAILFVILLSVPLGIVDVVMIDRYSQIWRTTSYQQTNGIVQKSRIRTEVSRNRGGGTTTYYHLDLGYTYAVNGRDHRGSRYDFRARSKEECENDLARHPVGQQVTVYFNPDDPEESVLRIYPLNGYILAVPLLLLPFHLSVLYILFRAFSRSPEWVAKTRGVASYVQSIFKKHSGEMRSPILFASPSRKAAANLLISSLILGMVLCFSSLGESMEIVGGAWILVFILSFFTLMRDRSTEAVPIPEPPSPSPPVLKERTAQTAETSLPENQGESFSITIPPLPFFQSVAAAGLILGFLAALALLVYSFVFREMDVGILCLGISFILVAISLLLLVQGLIQCQRKANLRCEGGILMVERSGLGGTSTDQWRANEIDYLCVPLFQTEHSYNFEGRYPTEHYTDLHVVVEGQSITLIQDRSESELLEIAHRVGDSLNIPITHWKLDRAPKREIPKPQDCKSDWFEMKGQIQIPVAGLDQKIVIQMVEGQLRIQKPSPERYAPDSPDIVQVWDAREVVEIRVERERVEKHWGRQRIMLRTTTSEVILLSLEDLEPISEHEIYWIADRIHRAVHIAKGV